MTILDGVHSTRQELQKSSRCLVTANVVIRERVACSCVRSYLVQKVAVTRNGIDDMRLLPFLGTSLPACPGRSQSTRTLSVVRMASA